MAHALDALDNGVADDRGVTTRHGVQFIYQLTPGNGVDGYLTESYKPDSVNASFVAIVAWADANNFVLDMIGEHRKKGSTIQRFNPEEWPYNRPDGPQLYCVGCENIGNLGSKASGTPTFSDDPFMNNAPEFSFVAYRCTFSPFLYDIRSDAAVNLSANKELIRYIERLPTPKDQSLSTLGQFEFGTAYTTATAWDAVTTYAIGSVVLSGGRVWISRINDNLNNTPVAGTRWTDVTGTRPGIPTPPAMSLPVTAWRYVWHYVPGPLATLRARARDFHGCVNLTDFDTSENPIKAGTGLYLTMEETPILATPGGNRLYRLAHCIMHNHKGWNNAYRANYAPNGASFALDAVGDFDSVRNRQTAQPAYKSKEFNDLFLL